MISLFKMSLGAGVILASTSVLALAQPVPYNNQWAAKSSGNVEGENAIIGKYNYGPSGYWGYPTYSANPGYYGYNSYYGTTPYYGDYR